MLNLKDGTLWQWDTGRKLIVTVDEGTTIDKVQFYNGIGDSARPGTIEKGSDGIILASIPDTLLQYSNNLTAYLMTTDEDGVKTTTSITMVVNARAKPEDYIFTDDEIFTYQKYEERLKYLEQNNVVESRVVEAIQEAENYSDKQLSEKATDLQNQIDVERARIDLIGSLEEGSTTGDAELMDIRIGYDGTTYDTAGQAVREQVSDIRGELKAVKIDAIYDERLGDLSFNVTEVLESAYSVGFENAEIGATGFEMSTAAVITENENFSYTEKFVLQEGVYIIPPVWKTGDPNYGYNSVRLIEFLKEDASVCTGKVFSKAYSSGGTEKTATIIAVVNSDKVYAVSNNNAVIEKFEFKKNTESVITPVTFDIVQMVDDGLNISESQYYLVFDITEQIPPEKVIGIKKMTHNAGTRVTYANQYGSYTTVLTSNKIIPTGKSWDSGFFKNQISTDGTTTWLSIGGTGDYLYNALVELGYKIFVE